MRRVGFATLLVVLVGAWMWAPSMMPGDGVAAANPGNSVAPMQDPSVVKNCWDREPIVVYDVSGGTLSGPYHRRLAVYTDGTASVSRVTGLPPYDVVDADFGTVSEAAAETLRTDLIAANANSLRDNCQLVTDVPLTTITFFALPRPNARSNTYSYFLTEGAWLAADTVINDFIDLHFPGF